MVQYEALYIGYFLILPLILKQHMIQSFYQQLLQITMNPVDKNTKSGPFSYPQVDDRSSGSGSRHIYYHDSMTD